MPFEIIRNDITRMQVDAIVNTANPRPVIGAGTDAAIHEKAGPALLQARQKIGRIRPGCCAVTPAFGLDAKFVIHAVGPVWRGGYFGEEARLRSCYDSALNLALEHGCRSIAFPLISTGNYGFPKDRALQIAIAAFGEFLAMHDMQIYLAVFSSDAFRLSKALYASVASYIDEHYVESKTLEEYGDSMPLRNRRMEIDRDEERMIVHEAPVCCPMPAPAAKSALSLTELLERTDAGFSETLLKLIDKSGKKDSQVYKKANISKQHFSKIRNNPDYKPTKSTALALAIALELDLEQTRDLIGRAGYALTKSSKFDVIIMYFIEHGNYNVVDINIALYEFDQSLLGG